ncbi:hypothetical protein M9458_010448, partial [Cirrhinus mrigala]
QGERSLENHTTDFVFFANLTHYPDSCLCSFYQAGLNTTTRAQLSRNGPRESLAAFVEWVLVSCGSPMTVDIEDDHASPTSDPVPRPTSPRSAERQPEPTADGEPKSNTTNEPSPRGATELRIAPEAETITSDQVREPATPLATEEVPVEHEDAEEGPAHCTSAEGEQILELGQMDLINFEDIYADMPPLIPPSSKLSVYPEPSVCPDLSACLDFPPTLPLLPHPLIPTATPPLSPDSPSAHPQPTICAVGLPRVSQFPSTSCLEDPSSPSPASESWTPPRLSDAVAPPQLLVLSSPIGPLAPLGSLVHPPSPQDSTPPAAPRRSVPLYWLYWAPPSLQLCLSPLSLGLRLDPPDPLCRLDSLALCLRLGLHHHLLRR